MNPFKKKDRERSQGEKNRKAIIQIVFRLVILFMLAVALIYGVVSLVTGSSLFIPTTANGVLDKVEQNNSYAWNVQIVRKINFEGLESSNDLTEQHRLMGAVLNQKENNFQTGVRGVFPIPVLYNSDGKYTLELVQGSEEFKIITDVCNGKPAINTSTISMPSPDTIKESSPRLVEDEETFFGERAWMLEIGNPSPELLKQLFWIDFLDQVSLNDGLEQWVLSDKERDLIEKEEYELERSKILVTYKKPYQIAQIDINVNIGDSRYRILAQLVPTEGENLLAEKDLGPPQCE